MSQVQENERIYDEDDARTDTGNGNGSNGAGAGSAADGKDEAKLLDLIQRTSMKPSEVVKILDKHIIGQKDAKRAVAVALRRLFQRMPHVPCTCTIMAS